MQNYINLQSIQAQESRYVRKLFSLVKKYGGYVEESVHVSPTEAADHMLVECPWIKSFFGNSFSSWDEVTEAAIDLAFTDSKRKVPDPLRQLANKMYEQAAPLNNCVRHSLSKDYSMISRFEHMLTMLRKYDAPVYNVDTVDSLGLAHLLGYISKYSPLSHYCPDLWFNNALGYAEIRDVVLSESELHLLAKCVVAIQKAFGVLDHIHELTPYSLEETQARALSTNPTSAYSLPTLANAKSKEQRAVQLRLAKDYNADPRSFGNVPYIGQRRIQQGGNVLLQYIAVVSPGFNEAEQIPTADEFRAAIKMIAAERPWVEYYSKHNIEPDGYSVSSKLPDDIESRTALVDAGVESSAILLKFKDGSWRFNFKVSEPCPWKLISDDADTSAKIDPAYHNMLLSKNRVVFAGSNPIAINKQSYIHKITDCFKEWTAVNGHNHMTVSWKPLDDIRVNLTNMAALVNEAPNAKGEVIPKSLDIESFTGCMSGDDKSSFDNFQAWTLWCLCNCCIIAPCFKPEYYDVLKWSSLQVAFPQVMTWKGLIAFSEAMPSGEGSTNFQDGFISGIGGLFDLCQRTGATPEKVMATWEKHSTGMVFQGDDYEGTDQPGADLDMKQANFLKLGLFVAPHKSLVSKYSFEYVRMFSNTGYRYYPGAGKENFLACHAPLAHAMVKVDFGEHAKSISPAIDSVSNINRLTNLQYHYKFVDIAREFVQYDAMHLGVEPVWYVPLSQTKAWREAGSPEKSKYHVLISSPQHLVKVAAMDAEWAQTNLSSATDISWQAQFDDTTKFENLRSVKVLNALRRNDEAELKRLSDMVRYEPMYNRDFTSEAE